MPWKESQMNIGLNLFKDSQGSGKCYQESSSSDPEEEEHADTETFTLLQKLNPADSPESDSNQRQWMNVNV